MNFLKKLVNSIGFSKQDSASKTFKDKTKIHAAPSQQHVHAFKQTTVKQINHRSATKNNKKTSPPRFQNNQQPHFQSSHKSTRHNATKNVSSKESYFNQNISFTSFGLETSIITALTKLQFVHPTDIQVKSIPIILEEKNVVCSSETGSGKTLAFLLPIFDHLLKKKIHGALIVVPTREIAIQIEMVLKQFLSNIPLQSTLIIGGVDMGGQKKALRNYPQIIVATPGRLLDILTTGLLWLQYTDLIVLDEADRMVDMGFEKDLIRIHNELPGTKQSLFFTATLLDGVERLIARYAKNVQRIVIGDRLAAGKNIEHAIIHVNREYKIEKLCQLLRSEPDSVIVFFNTIRESIRCHGILKKQSLPHLEIIHSGKDQYQRQEIIHRLKTNRSRILLATDLASRGLDLSRVSMVINYDLPTHPEEYIHRIGRTGRAGESGKAYSLYTKNDTKRLKAIESLIQTPIHVLKETISHPRSHPPKKSSFYSSKKRNPSPFKTTAKNR